MLKGSHHTEEWKGEQSIRMSGTGNPMHGRHHSEMTKKKMAERKRGKPLSKKHRERLSAVRRGRKLTTIHRERIRLSKLGDKNPRGMLGTHHSKETIEKMKATHKELWRNSEYKKCRSKLQSEQWKDEEYKERRLQEMHKGMFIQPNKPEQFLINICNKHNFPYKYVGNGEFILAGKIPDFLNVNGQKKIIEVYGDYWHRNDDPQDRINLFKQYGFDTLVFWEHEVYDEDYVVKKIGVFDGN